MSWSTLGCLEIVSNFLKKLASCLSRTIVKLSSNVWSLSCNNLSMDSSNAWSLCCSLPSNESADLQWKQASTFCDLEPWSGDGRWHLPVPDISARVWWPSSLSNAFEGCWSTLGWPSKVFCPGAVPFSAIGSGTSFGKPDGNFAISWGTGSCTYANIMASILLIILLCQKGWFFTYSTYSPGNASIDSMQTNALSVCPWLIIGRTYRSCWTLEGSFGNGG